MHFLCVRKHEVGMDLHGVAIAVGMDCMMCTFKGHRHVHVPCFSFPLHAYESITVVKTTLETGTDTHNS